MTNNSLFSLVINWTRLLVSGNKRHLIWGGEIKTIYLKIENMDNTDSPYVNTAKRL